MPSIAVQPTNRVYTKEAIYDWFRRRGLIQLLYGTIDNTNSEEDEVGPLEIEFPASGEPIETLWIGATNAALNTHLANVYKVSPGGNANFDDVAILTGNDLPDDLVLITGYEDLRDQFLKAYNQALMDRIAELETGSEEQLLALFRDLFAPLPDQVSERLQQFIARFEHGTQDLQPIASPTVSEVKYLVGWLYKQDPKVYATVTDDGILALEANLASLGKLFVEVDRTGSVEATIVSANLGIRGLDATSISELTSVPIASLISGP